MSRNWRHDPPASVTWEEAEEAAIFAVKTTIRGKSSKWKDRNFALHYDPAGWSKAVEGAIGERALANYLKIKNWKPDFDGMQKPDMQDIDAKTRTDHSNDMILHEESAKEDRIYVLLTGLAPHYRVRGWLYGYEIMDEDHEAAYRRSPMYKHGEPTRWLATPAELRHIDTLEDLRDAYRPVQTKKARKA